MNVNELQKSILSKVNEVIETSGESSLYENFQTHVDVKSLTSEIKTLNVNDVQLLLTNLYYETEHGVIVTEAILDVFINENTWPDLKENLLSNTEGQELLINTFGKDYVIKLAVS